MVTRLFRRTSGYTTFMEHMAIISYVYVLSVPVQYSENMSSGNGTNKTDFAQEKL